MKIAFLGKGGSGKSTLATATVRYLHRSGYRVLAIDADHNMDLAFNLGIEAPEIALGSDPALIKAYVGLSDGASFADAYRTAAARGIAFSIAPADPFTESISMSVADDLMLIVAGPHTDRVRSGSHCSHSLAAPLKVYLPLLALKEDEAVVLDERAGTDPVATGILTGVDCAFIVVEPTVHSVRVGSQIADELRRAEIPFEFIANKVDGPHALFADLPAEPYAYIAFGASGPSDESVARIAERARNR